MLTVIGFLVVLAVVTVIASALNKCPLWVPVAILCLIELLRVLPLGH